MINDPAQEDGEVVIPKKIRLYRKLQNKKRRTPKVKPVVVPELLYDSRGWKKRKLCELSFKEKLDIAHKYLIQHWSLADIAHLYQVKPALVKYLAKKVQKDDSVLAEHQAAEVNLAERKAAIITVAIKLDKTPDGILRAGDVVEEVKETQQVEVKLKLVRETLKEDLHMGYRQLKRIARHGNSARCLILRKLFAEKLIELLYKGKTILNCDETWVNIRTYRRWRWR